MNSKPKISLFTMKACGYCTQAKQMFAAELASGEMIEKPASEAPQGTRGFPTFTADNKTHSGLPQTKKQLYEKLDIGISKEKYKNVYRADPDKPDNPKVYLFTMKGCGYCTQAKQMFASELASGEMIEKPASEAPPGTRGFPTFTANGNTHPGLPQTKKQLYEKLDIGISKEKYKNVYRADPLDITPDFTNLYIDQKFSDYDKGKQYLYIPINNKMLTDLTITGLIIEYGSVLSNSSKPFALVYNSNDTVKPRKTLDSAKYTTTNVHIVTTIEKENFLTKIFPCTSIEDWKPIFNSNTIDQAYLVKLSSKLMPPQPCKNDNSVYCCPGTTGPKAVVCPPCTDTVVCEKHKFFDIKTIFMICFILLLLSILLYVIMNSSSSSGVTSVLSSGTSSISSNK